jgi:hypothetical protein
MISARYAASCWIVGSVASLVAMSLPTAADELVNDPIDRMPVRTIADHCAAFGPGFVDVGGHVCARTETHVRVYVGRGGPLGATLGSPWPPSSAANAALRSDAIVPGAQVSHLRVRGGLEDLNPFR